MGRPADRFAATLHPRGHAAAESGRHYLRGGNQPRLLRKKQEDAYSAAILEAALAINDNPRPFYFLRAATDVLPEVPLWHVDRGKGRAVASIVACTDDWFDATGYDTSDANRFIGEDLRSGRLPEVLGAAAALGAGRPLALLLCQRRNRLRSAEDRQAAPRSL